MRELQMEEGSVDPGLLGLFLASRPGKPGTVKQSNSLIENSQIVLDHLFCMKAGRCIHVEN